MLEIKRVDIGPNDVLLFSTEARLSTDGHKTARAAIEEKLAEMGITNKFMILSGGLRLEVLRKEAA